ncbi:MAG: FprA family A-type flavoprotein [candidate division Zixibacteria bacterium]|nr:FprA family A-type flavoprotein [candidate division Zixibacteria bacterium]
MNAMKISEDVYWVGVHDPELDYFDIIMKTDHGTTYNAYLIKGVDKVALVDTVKAQFADEYLAKVAEIVPLDKIDYLIVNHTEPDHAGAMVRLLDKAPGIEIVCSASAVPFVKNTINRDARITPVKDNHEIDLGGKKLVFKLMPYMHWPDTMMEFLAEDGILFSNDGFAAHIASDKLFADELPDDIDLDREVKYYYSMIMRPFNSFIRKNLPKLDDFNIRMVATSHGPLYRTEPDKYIKAYGQWSQDKSEGKNGVVIFYASSYGNTLTIADNIAAGLAKHGFEITKADVTQTDDETSRDLIESSKAVLIGTPTFAGDAVKPVWDLVNLFSTVDRTGKKAAVFGSYGWGGEGLKLVADRLAGLKLKVFEEPFRARLVPSDDDLNELAAYTDRLAEFIGQ